MKLILTAKLLCFSSKNYSTSKVHNITMYRNMLVFFIPHVFNQISADLYGLLILAIESISGVISPQETFSDFYHYDRKFAASVAVCFYHRYEQYKHTNNYTHGHKKSFIR